MGDYQHAVTVQANVDRLFDYLSEVRNLPHYFGTMTEAEPAGGEAVRVVAMVQGKREEGEAWFRTDGERNRIEWGSEGPNDYHGWLEITGEGETSTVTIHLHTERADGGEIDKGVQAVGEKIRQLVEAGKADAS